MTLKENLIDFICRNFMVEMDEIDLSFSLVDQGIIDSFGLVEISTFFKKQYGIITEQSEMNRDNFGSVEKMVTYAEKKINK